MKWLTNLFSDAGKLHVSSQWIKVLGVAAGLAVGFSGHDWAAGAGVMTAALAGSVMVSQSALSKTNSVGVDPKATEKVGQ